MSSGSGRLNNPQFVTWLVRALFVVCVALVLSDALYHKHTHFLWEGWFGFFGLFGFVTFFLLVLAGKHLRKLLMRGEDYYDR